MCALARLYLKAADYAAAEPLAREVLAAAIIDSEPARLAASYLGQIYKETDRNTEAVGHYRAAAESLRRVFGNAAETTLNHLQHLLQAVAAEGAMTEAFKLAIELLRWQREMQGEYHKGIIETKKDLIFIYPALGFWPEAELI
jgi:tetratricopeptide (TPR) repeat protein